MSLFFVFQFKKIVSFSIYFIESFLFVFVHFFVCFFILAFKTKQCCRHNIRKEQDDSPETDEAAVAGGGLMRGGTERGRKWRKRVGRRGRGVDRMEAVNFLVMSGVIKMCRESIS